MVFLVYLVFLEVFAVPSPTVQKLEENQKKQKKKKNNPVRIILGKSIRDWFFSFFFVPKNSRKTKTNKKTNPVRRILGKSIQDCFFLFFGFIWFFSRFLLSQAQLSKNWRQQNYLCRKRSFLYRTDYPIVYLKEVGSRKKIEEKNDLQRKYLKGNGV